MHVCTGPNYFQFCALGCSAPGISALDIHYLLHVVGVFMVFDT